ncbi:phosphatidate cytidylyltransferase [Engelhardtia mirabilis]|uniref:Phosphatidate cytidylyltransferase n=1 Tax=Engelhardtia mirabilis TaxID=2528011 RepID=A0A518BPT8_9BACT|nr:Phosphatidate cytidylyltransferase [Planctomycetes bacterium Pla133]QDV03324.1 Phosphatidate cytidylyltransferase [Planctomycetes bacterium Pla86]
MTDHRRGADPKDAAPRGASSDAASSSKPRSKRAAILRRTLTGGGLALVVTLLIVVADELGSSLPVLGVAALLAAASVWELGGLGSLALAPRRVGLWAALVAVVGLAWLGVEGSISRGALGGLLVYGAAGAAGLVGHSAAGGREAGRLARTGLLALWVAPALPLMAWIHLDHGTRGLVLLIVLSKVGDIAGYYGGNAFGRHHPFPHLSPGKTTEGCLASLVGGAVCGAALGAANLLPAIREGLSPTLVGLGLGVVINLAAQAGDLVESLAKRRSGVKDSSAALGASGGFLDVVDSLLLTVPVALLAWGLVFV